jgi:hypothetical protein
MGAGFSLLVAQGCRKQDAAAPVQPVVRTVSQVRPDFALGSLPVEDVDAGVTPTVKRAARPRYQAQPVQPVQPVQVRSTDAQAAAQAQRRRDERLLEQQQAESQRQQEELNRDIEETMKIQQEVQAEPRIQDNPGAAQAPPMQPSSPE